MTEEQFLDTVVALAKLHRWKVAHFRPAQMQSGRWATPMKGDKGFPDLTLARRGVVMFAELKSEVGRLSKEQKEWGEELGDLFHVWRPSDLPRIADLLR